MSNSALLNIGTRAMFAAQSQLSTTGHNIANANVAGYSRQEAQLTTVGGYYTGAGYYGRGVAVQTVTRAVNGFLTDQAAQTRAQSSADQTRADALVRLQSSFGTGEAGLGYAATQLFNAFSDVASTPADLSARQVVLARAQDLASMFRATSDQIEAQQSSVTQDLQNTVGTVNGITASIARLNDQIAGTRGTGQSPNDLLDQREQLIDRLSEYVQVTRLEQDDGALNLFIGGGQSVVLGNSAFELKAVPDTFDPARTQIKIDMAGTQRSLSAANLGGGSLAGLVTFQNEDLTAARDQLGLLAGTLSRELNQQQARGLDLGGTAGAALLAFGQPNVIAANSNALDAGGQFVGQLGLTVTDSSALQASEYELTVETGGTFSVLRRSDGQTFGGLANGATLDGFRIDISAGTPAAGDRFLLQPVSTAAQGMDRALSDPRGIAAASPLTATAHPANTGTSSVSSLSITDTPTSAYQGLTLTFGASSAAGRAYDLTDAAGAVVSSGTWSAGTPISHNGFDIKLDGVPASGDRFRIAPTTFASSSNGNALSLQGLGLASMTGGTTFTNAYSQTLSDLGVRVQSAQAAADVSAAVADRATQELGAQTGVNLDEEAARLIQYQQSYQAAAKVLQVAQKVFDTILSIAG